jgi:hypothetical protein
MRARTAGGNMNRGHVAGRQSAREHRDAVIDWERRVEQDVAHHSSAELVRLRRTPRTMIVSAEMGLASLMHHGRDATPKQWPVAPWRGLS